MPRGTRIAPLSAAPTAVSAWSSCEGDETRSPEPSPAASPLPSPRPSPRRHSPPAPHAPRAPPQDAAAASRARFLEASSERQFLAAAAPSLPASAALALLAGGGAFGALRWAQEQAAACGALGYGGGDDGTILTPAAGGALPFGGAAALAALSRLRPAPSAHAAAAALLCAGAAALPHAEGCPGCAAGLLAAICALLLSGHVAARFAAPAALLAVAAYVAPLALQAGGLATLPLARSSLPDWSSRPRCEPRLVAGAPEALVAAYCLAVACAALLRHRTERRARAAFALAVRARAARAATARDSSRVEDLLSAILPASLIPLLHRRQDCSVAVQVYQSVSLVVVVVRGFEDACSALSAANALRLWSELSAGFDTAVARHRCEIVKRSRGRVTVCCGLGKNTDHQQHAALCALAMHSAARSFLDHHREEPGVSMLRGLSAGAHCGKLSAGVIGTGPLAFDAWGATVDRANELADSAATAQTLVSATIHADLESRFEFREVQQHEALELIGRQEASLSQSEGVRGGRGQTAAPPREISAAIDEQLAFANADDRWEFLTPARLEASDGKLQDALRVRGRDDSNGGQGRSRRIQAAIAVVWLVALLSVHQGRDHSDPSYPAAVVLTALAHGLVYASGLVPFAFALGLASLNVAAGVVLSLKPEFISAPAPFAAVGCLLLLQFDAAEATRRVWDKRHAVAAGDAELSSARRSQLLSLHIPPWAASRLQTERAAFAVDGSSVAVLEVDVMGLTSAPSDTFGGGAAVTLGLALLHDAFAVIEQLAQAYAVSFAFVNGTRCVLVTGLGQSSSDAGGRPAVNKLSDFALHLIAAITDFNAQRGLDAEFQIRIRCGMSFGAASAVLVGRAEELSFDLWGPTVATAAAMCDKAQPGELVGCSACLTILQATHTTETISEGAHRIVQKTDQEWTDGFSPRVAMLEEAAKQSRAGNTCKGPCG